MRARVAIVGVGPRGLHALEVLSRALNDTGVKPNFDLLLFDDSGYAGSGPNYAPDQPTQNILNIPSREVPLSKRDEQQGVIRIPGFPDYADWQEEHEDTDNFGKDVFPPRATIGRYLQARFQSWLSAWREQAHAQLFARSVVAISDEGHTLILKDDQGNSHSLISHVLLTIGHQPVERDDALQQWVSNSEHKPGITLFEHPYPTNTLRDANSIGTNDTVAIRGMGLSMIDVVKSITEGRGGEFETMDEQGSTLRYIPSTRDPALMVLFSLDGLPMSPKPANADFDRSFTPTQDEYALLVSRIAVENRPETGEALKNTIVHKMASICSAVYQRLSKRRLMAG